MSNQFPLHQIPQKNGSGGLYHQGGCLIKASHDCKLKSSNVKYIFYKTAEAQSKKNTC